MVLQANFFMWGFILFNIVGFWWLLVHGTSRIIVDHNENGYVSFEKKGPLMGTKFSSVPRSRIKNTYVDTYTNQDGHIYFTLVLGTGERKPDLTLGCDGWRDEDRFTAARLISERLNLD